MDIEYAVGIIRRDDIDPMAIDQLQTIRLATSFSIPIMDISFHDTQKTIDAIKIVKRFGGMSIVVDSLSRLSRDWQSLQSIFKHIYDADMRLYIARDVKLNEIKMNKMQTDSGIPILEFHADHIFLDEILDQISD